MQLWFKRNQAIRNVLAPGGELSPQARVLMGALGQFCHARRSSVMVGNGGQIDPYATMVAEGRREVFNWLLDILEVNEHDARKIMQDYKEEMRNDAERNEY